MMEYIWRRIRCSSKRGYTMTELMVVVTIMGLIGAFGADSFRDLTIGYENVRVKTEQSVSDLKTIVYIDRLLQGCDSVEVINESSLEVVKNDNKEIFTSGKFGKEENITFTKDIDKIVINIGGEEYCVPILLKDKGEAI